MLSFTAIFLASFHYSSYDVFFGYEIRWIITSLSLLTNRHKFLFIGIDFIIDFHHIKCRDDQMALRLSISPFTLSVYFIS